MNLVELAEQDYQKFGEITKIVFNDREYSNLELTQSANKLAHGLENLGIGVGDKVLVMLMNQPEVLISYQAILRTGAIIIPVIFLLGPKEIAHIMRSSSAKAIITTKSFLDSVQLAMEGIDTLETVIIVEDEEIPNTITYQKVIDECSEKLPKIKIESNDLAVILYTSGTTGVPKGVMLTHRNLYTNAESIYKTNPDADPTDVNLFILPLSHSFGLTVMNIGFMRPQKNVMMPWFDIEQACQLIEKYMVNDFAGVPAMFAMILNSPEITDRYDLSSLKECKCGSAALPVEVLKGFEQKFSCVIVEGYGLSEAGPVVTAHYNGRKKKTGSVGQAIPNVEVRIVDNGGAEVPTGEIGELIVSGDSISPGYYDLPEKTEETFKNGWLYTGDIAKMDDDGYVFIVDRKKDLIIRGGFNIVPRDIEEVLYKHPDIIDAAVVGIPNAVFGEEVKAYVILKDNVQTTETKIIDHCKTHLAKYKCPVQVEFLDIMPRSPIGKILRKELRERSQNRSPTSIKSQSL